MHSKRRRLSSVALLAKGRSCSMLVRDKLIRVVWESCSHVAVAIFTSGVADRCPPPTHLQSHTV
jgi:hypothetical protein